MIRYLIVASIISSCAMHENAKIIDILNDDGRCYPIKQITIYQTESGKRYSHCGYMGKIGDEFQVTKDNLATLNADQQIGEGA